MFVMNLQIVKTVQDQKLEIYVPMLVNVMKIIANVTTSSLGMVVNLDVRTITNVTIKTNA